jgi:urease accessory protein
MQLAEPVAASWKASLSLGFQFQQGRTVLANRISDGPLVVQKALYPEGPDVCQAIVVHPPAGIAGGDELLLAAAAGKEAHAQLTTPGAGKFYRSAGALARQTLRFEVDGSLEWLPRETIVYDGALAELECEVRLGEGARYVGWEIICLGRTGSGERFERGRLKLETRVFAQDRLVWFERGMLEGGGAALRSPAGLAGRTVFGTMVASAPGLGGLQVARYLGDSTEEAFERFSSLWRELRPAVIGRDAVTPRIWST